MKKWFIFKDGKPYGNEVGYTTEKGARKSLVGCAEWINELAKYPYYEKDAIPEDIKNLGIYEWGEYVNCWLLDRRKWSIKVWNPYVKEHYEFKEMECKITREEL